MVTFVDTTLAHWFRVKLCSVFVKHCIDVKVSETQRSVLTWAQCCADGTKPLLEYKSDLHVKHSKSMSTAAVSMATARSHYQTCTRLGGYSELQQARHRMLGGEED